MQLHEIKGESNVHAVVALFRACGWRVLMADDMSAVAYATWWGYHGA